METTIEDAVDAGAVGGVDTNLVFLCGRVASAPDLETGAWGERVARLLVTVRTNHPRRRIDVIPVTQRDPDPGLEKLAPGDWLRVWGSIERRIGREPDGRRTRIEVVAACIARCGEGDVTLR
jgi:hypothetical protein